MPPTPIIMGWDFEAQNHNVTLPSMTHERLTTSKSDYPAVETESDRAANMTDLISSELILICIASYLAVPSLVALSSTTREIRAAMHSTPGVWRTVDVSDISTSPHYSEINLLKFLRQPYVSRDCRVLILDGLSFDHQFLDHVLLREMPSLHSISLLSCPNLNGDQLIKLIDYIRRPSAQRPLALKSMALLGAPLFALNTASIYAPVIVAAAGDEIETDLHGLQCMGEDHRVADMREGKWHLKVQYPNHPCAVCSIQQDVCMKCHVKKSCVGCHSFYCDNCEPYPSVTTPPPPSLSIHSFPRYNGLCFGGRWC